MEPSCSGASMALLSLSREPVRKDYFTENISYRIENADGFQECPGKGFTFEVHPSLWSPVNARASVDPGHSPGGLWTMSRNK
jgi:hypothetical protein